MRRWASVAVLLAALVCADLAMADTPATVYSDFAEDGVLSCGHSRSAMKGVLNDASLHQYGDPLTFLGLKLAIRKQLAGGCRRQERAAVFFGSAGGDSPSAPAPQPQPGTASPPGEKTTTPPVDPEPSVGEPSGEAARATTGDKGQDGRMILLGVVLLLVTLGSGGWAARRAFAD